MEHDEPLSFERREVGTGEAGTRLDRFLADQESVRSRSRARELLEAKRVFVNGNAAPPSTLLVAGDVVEFAALPTVEAQPDLVRDLPPLKVLADNEFFIAVEKRRGMPSVRLAEPDPPTVADFLALYAPETAKASPDPRESGLVQRLDTYTSGIIIAAKSRAVWQPLVEVFRTGKAEKTYLAIVQGRAPEAKLMRSIILDYHSGERMKSVEYVTKKVEPWKLQHAETSITLVQHLSHCDATIVRCTTKRARRHQVRLHCAESGHPLIGDRTYGSERSLLEIHPDFPSDGFLLHAETLSFNPPWGGGLVEITSNSELVDRCLS